MNNAIGDAFEQIYFGLIPIRDDLRRFTDGCQKSIEAKSISDIDFKEKWGKYVTCRYSSFFRIAMAKDQIEKLVKIQSDYIDKYIFRNDKGITTIEMMDYRELVESIYNNLNNAINSFYWEIAILSKNINPSDVHFRDDVKNGNPYWTEIEPHIEAIRKILKRRQLIAHYWIEFNVKDVVWYLYMESDRGTAWGTIEAKWKECEKEMRTISPPPDLSEVIKVTNGYIRAGYIYLFNLEEIAKKYSFLRAECQCKSDLDSIVTNMGNVYKVLLDKAITRFNSDNGLQVD